MQERIKKSSLIGLGTLGLLFASMAGLSEHVSWLAAFCTVFSDGCRETARFTLLHVPIWIWGIGFYALLLGCVFRAEACLAWLVPGAVGVEVALVGVMIAMKIFCVFCLANLALVFLLLVLSFERRRMWQTIALAAVFCLLGSSVLPLENRLHASTPSPPPVQAAEEASAPAARVADKVITNQELKAAAGGRLRDLEQEIHKLKRQRLDQLVVEALLQKEASERGMTLDQLVNIEVLSKTGPVSEPDIDRYIEENKARLPEWKGTMEELRVRVREHLERQKRLEDVIRYAHSLESKYPVEILLKEPDSLALKVNAEGSPSLGPSDAPVTVFEFSDYQCPACRQGHEVVHRVREMYSGRLRWVFKNYPLKMHKDAERAAKAALCAGDQNRFWDYQDVLFATREDLTSEKLEELASNIGLMPAPFKQCLDSDKYRSRVEQDVVEAQKAGVDRTPTFVVNGRMVTGALALEQFKSMIDEEISKAGAKDKK